MHCLVTVPKNNSFCTEPRGLVYSWSLTRPHCMWNHINSRFVLRSCWSWKLGQGESGEGCALKPTKPSLFRTHPCNINSLEASTWRCWTFKPKPFPTHAAQVVVFWKLRNYTTVSFEIQYVSGQGCPYLPLIMQYPWRMNNNFLYQNA